MLYVRFVVAAAALFLLGLAFYCFSDPIFDIPAGNSYLVINLSYLLVAAGISMIVPGATLIYIELILKKDLPKKLTKISYTLHLGGLLILLTSMLIILTENREWIIIMNTFVYLGLFLTVAGMSILPAILMISLRKRRGN
jgi:uncharacterized membrane protein